MCARCRRENGNKEKRRKQVRFDTCKKGGTRDVRERRNDPHNNIIYLQGRKKRSEEKRRRRFWAFPVNKRSSHPCPSRRPQTHSLSYLFLAHTSTQRQAHTHHINLPLLIIIVIHFPLFIYTLYFILLFIYVTFQRHPPSPITHLLFLPINRAHRFRERERAEMCHDDWVKVAMADDSLVVDLLLRLHQAPPPPPPPPGLNLQWTVRQRRSKYVPRHALPSNKAEPTRASPTTPLSWSGATSASCGALDGYEESSCPSKHSHTSRSKVPCFIPPSFPFSFFLFFSIAFEFSDG